MLKYPTRYSKAVSDYSDGIKSSDNSLSPTTSKRVSKVNSRQNIGSKEKSRNIQVGINNTEMAPKKHLKIGLGRLGSVD